MVGLRHVTIVDCRPCAWVVRDHNMKRCSSSRNIKYVYVFGSQLHIHKCSKGEGRLHTSFANMVPMEMASSTHCAEVARSEEAGWSGEWTKKEKDGQSSERKDVFFLLWSVPCGLTSHSFLYNPLSTSLTGRLYCEKNHTFLWNFSQKTLLLVEVIPFVFVLVLISVPGVTMRLKGNDSLYSLDVSFVVSAIVPSSLGSASPATARVSFMALKWHKEPITKQHFSFQCGLLNSFSQIGEGG